MKHKTFIALSLLVATTLTLSACATSSTPKPVVTVTEQLPLPEPEPITDEDTFLQTLRTSGNSYLESADSSSLLDAGYETCNLLDQGYTATELVLVLASSGEFQTTEEQQAVGYLMGAAIAIFCPEYAYQVS